MLFINAIVSASVANRKGEKRVESKVFQGRRAHSACSEESSSELSETLCHGLSQAPAGKLGAWNEEFSFAKVQPCDYVAEVNGVPGLKDMSQELQKRAAVRLRILRFPPVFEVNLPAGQEAPGRVVGLKYDPPMNDRDTGLTIKDIVPDSRMDHHNRSCVEGSRFHLVVMTGFRIEGVNGVHGAGQKLQRALLEARSGPIHLTIRRVDKPPAAGLPRKAMNRFRNAMRAMSGARLGDELDTGAATHSLAETLPAEGWGHVLRKGDARQQEAAAIDSSVDFAATMPPGAMRSAVRFNNEVSVANAERDVVSPMMSEIMHNLDYDDPFARTGMSMISMTSDVSMPTTPQVPHINPLSPGHATSVASLTLTEGEGQPGEAAAEVTNNLADAAAEVAQQETQRLQAGAEQAHVDSDEAEREVDAAKVLAVEMNKRQAALEKALQEEMMKRQVQMEKELAEKAAQRRAQIEKALAEEAQRKQAALEQAWAEEERRLRSLQAQRAEEAAAASAKAQEQEAKQALHEALVRSALVESQADTKEKADAKQAFNEALALAMMAKAPIEVQANEGEEVEVDVPEGLKATNAC
ncbi:Uap1 [Symbiodinium sp. CCMP2456]|nr:Uap1 [Symbiodinium sp. CCMP2456]